MSEKRLASEKTVQAFIRAVYPESTELCMTVNSEEDVLREATRLILGRRAPDPEKQELWNAIDNYGEHRRGCHKVYRSDRGECACGLDALLCRIPEEKP